MKVDLEIQDVTKYYKKFKAIDNVSLKVNRGEFLTLLGPSGSGKTTLLKMIAGFEELNDGSILLKGQNIEKKKPYERNIGMVFQNYALFPHMTVADNVAFPLLRRKVKKKEAQLKVQEILKIVQLENYGNRYPSQLSGGQQQRVALARSIVFNPPLLLLDEPMGALDKRLRQQMQLEIKHIQEDLGITTISVTHDQEEALTMSDRICVMNNGQIEQIDTPEGLYKHPKNRFVAEFIGEISLLRGILMNVESGYAKVKLNSGEVITSHIDMSEEQQINKPVLIAIRPEGIQILKKGQHLSNIMSVKVMEMIYLGETTIVKAKTQSDEWITIKIPPVFSSEEMSVGKKVRVGWNTIESTLLVDEEAVLNHDKKEAVLA